eukprot:10086453-Prorocentrum_lima.AAC.1
MGFDQWYHCVWMRKGDTFYGYVDGVLGSNPFTLTTNASAYFDGATRVSIGGSTDRPPNNKNYGFN